MTNLVAIDPAVRCSGWALFREGRLVSCGVVEAKSIPEALKAAALWASRLPTDREYSTIIEYPQVYRPGTSKVDPNDVVGIGIVGGGYAAALVAKGPIEFVEPARWKGQAPKEVVHERARKVLAAWESQVLTAGLMLLSDKKSLDALDAVSLGLWKLGRVER